MLKKIYRRAKEYFELERPYDRPPSRDGCIDVTIYADPEGEDDEAFLQQVQRLKAIQAQDRTPPVALQRYFADRYLDWGITHLVGCSFQVYLARPLLVEKIRDDIASSRP